MTPFESAIRQLWYMLGSSFSRMSSFLLRLSPLPDFYDVVIIIIVVVVILYKFIRFSVGK